MSYERGTMILLTRKAEFSSAHYYWNEAWTEAENLRVFGRCANKNGHGHNYTLEVTVAGEVDAVSGFVVDLKELKEILQREVVSVYDHRHLNLEVPEFAAGDVAISIVGVPMFCWLLVRSYLHHRVTRSVDWKGRRYKVGR